MADRSQQQYELTEAPGSSALPNNNTTMPQDEEEAEHLHTVDARLHKATLRKLDCLLLPFLALLFLFNALDKSNVCKPMIPARAHVKAMRRVWANAGGIRLEMRSRRTLRRMLGLIRAR
jgi:hypothetical protein